MKLYWNKPPYQLTLIYNKGQVTIRGLDFVDEGFSLTNAEGGGYIPATEDDVQLTEDHGCTCLLWWSRQTMRREGVLFSMKRLLSLTVILLLLYSYAFADPIGFGYVNNTDVALRRGIGGKVLVRLPQNTGVWIKESKADSQGTLWYHINAGANVDYTNVDFDGWMKAEFIDAGDALWHDIVSISASRTGLIALLKDGTTLTVGRPIVSQDGTKWVPPTQEFSHSQVTQVAADNSNGYAVLTHDGHFSYSIENPSAANLRLIGGSEAIFGITRGGDLLSLLQRIPMSWIYPASGLNAEGLSHITKMADSYSRLLLLSDEGQVYTVFLQTDLDDTPEPAWETWNHVKDISGGWIRLYPGRHDSAAYVAVREDGTVLAAPQALNDLLGSWTGMKQIELNVYFILGLKEDGTAVSVSGVSEAPDVSAWKDVVAIGCGSDYCVGLKKDGTLVFAGEHIFMGEGHNRK